MYVYIRHMNVSFHVEIKYKKGLFNCYAIDGLLGHLVCCKNLNFAVGYYLQAQVKGYLMWLLGKSLHIRNQGHLFLKIKFL